MNQKRMEPAKTKLATALSGSPDADSVFKPKPDFYEKVGIRRKRFGQIYRGERSPTIEEVERLAEYKGIDKFSLL